MSRVDALIHPLRCLCEALLSRHYAQYNRKRLWHCIAVQLPRRPAGTSILCTAPLLPCLDRAPSTAAATPGRQAALRTSRSFSARRIGPIGSASLDLSALVLNRD
jgi:hypothetical protein